MLSWLFQCFTGVPGPFQVIIPLTPTLMAEQSIPTILYLCWGLSLLTSSILRLSLLIHIQVFQIISLVQQSNFKFQSCLPGHLQPSRLSHYPSTNRNSDQIPTRAVRVTHISVLTALGTNIQLGLSSFYSLYVDLLSHFRITISRETMAKSS